MHAGSQNNNSDNNDNSNNNSNNKKQQQLEPRRCSACGVLRGQARAPKSCFSRLVRVATLCLLEWTPLVERPATHRMHIGSYGGILGRVVGPAREDPRRR